jgi:hypothetical protein
MELAVIVTVLIAALLVLLALREAGRESNSRPHNEKKPPLRVRRR